MRSPLRYPGGKAKLLPFFIQVIADNSLYDKIYAEPYAGGAGLALKLLAHGFIRRVELNDIDPAIAAFWHSVITQPDALCSLVREAPVHVDEWRRQRGIYEQGLAAGRLALGFSAFYLNRTSRSGIIEGSGPIGGYQQNSKWAIDARYNRLALVSQIQEIARYSDKITVTSIDAIDFMRTRLLSTDIFMYLDPPYYNKGQKLYKNFYEHSDHEKIKDLLGGANAGLWVLSYDYAPEIIRMYNQYTPIIYNLRYTAGANGQGMEVIFRGNQLKIPLHPKLSIAA